MKKIQVNNKIASIVAGLGFLISLALSIIVFGVTYIQGLLSNNGFLGLETTVSAGCIATSIIFIAVLFLITFFGFILKNKFMLLLSAVYQVLLILLIVMLVIFMLAEITNPEFYNILLWVLAIFLAPIFGSVWVMGSFFFLVFAILIVFTIYAFVKTFKKTAK